MNPTTLFFIAAGAVWLGAMVRWQRQLDRQTPPPFSIAGRRAAAEAQELARTEVLIAAGFVVSAALTLYAPLYDTPTQPGPHNSTRTHAHS